MKLILSLILFTSLSAFGNQFKKCENSFLKKTQCKLSIEDIRPTQFSFGKVAAVEKIKKVEKEYKKNKLDQFLKKKMAPVILGPNKEFFIIDRHHTSYAIYHANIPAKNKYVIAEIIEDWSDLSLEDFISKMNAHHYLWLLDENYNVRKFSELPLHVDQMVDDPYRSLAWLVRENEGFEKINVSFIEFMWAQFFKDQNIIIEDSTMKSLNKVLEESLELAKSPLASHLPGHKN